MAAFIQNLSRRSLELFISILILMFVAWPCHAQIVQMGGGPRPRGAAPSELPTDIPSLVEKIKSGGQDRWQAMDKLFQSNDEKAKDAILSLMTASDDGLRADVIQRLQNRRDTSYIEPLAAALKDPSTRVRGAAAQALAGMNNDNARAALLVMLDDPLPEYRRQALQGLKGMPTEKLVPVVEKMIKDPSPDVRSETIGLLRLDSSSGSPAFYSGDMRMYGRIPAPRRSPPPFSGVKPTSTLKDEKLIAIVLDSAKDSSFFVRAAVADVLRYVPAEKGVEALIELSKDPEPEVRAASIASVSVLDDPRIAEVLDRAATDTSIWVRGRAAVAFGLEGKWNPDRILVLLKDPDPFVRSSAANSFGNRQNLDENLVNALIEALKDPMPDVRSTAIRSLSRANSEQAGKAVVEAFNDPSPDVRRTVLDSYGNRSNGEIPFELLKAAMNDPVSDIRQSVSWRLQNSRDPRMAELLIPMLDSPDVNVRSAAVNALGQRKDATAFDPLALRLKDSAPQVRMAAIQALGSIGGERLADLMAGMLDDENQEVRRSATRVLARLKDQRGIKGIDELLHSTSADDRANGLSMLSDISGSDAAEMAAPLLQDSEQRIRRQAAAFLAGRKDERGIQYLLELGANPANVDTNLIYSLPYNEPRVLPLLNVAIKSSNPELKRAGIDRLSNLRNPDSIDTFIILLSDPDAQTRRSAAYSLGNVSRTNSGGFVSGFGKAIEPLAALVEKDADSEVRRAAMQTLSQSRDQKAKDAMLAILEKSQDDQIRQRALESFVQSKDDRAAEPVMKLIKDPATSPSLRGAAIRALAAVSGAAAADTLAEYLQDKNREVRTEAARALAGFKDARAMKAIETMLSSAAGEDRRSGLSLLQSNPDKEAVPLAVPLLNDPDKGIRRMAAVYLANQKDSRGFDALVDMAAEPGALDSEFIFSLPYGKDPRIAEIVKKAFASTNGNVKSAALDRLSNMRIPEGLDMCLAAAVSDPDRQFRLRAINALQNFSYTNRGQASQNYQKVIDPMMAILDKDSDMDMRRAALEAMGPAKDDRVIERAVAILSDEKQAQLHSAAVRVLDRADNIPPAAVKPLLAALRKYDSDVSSAAARTLAKCKDEPGVVEALNEAFACPNTQTRAAAISSLMRIGASTDDQLKKALDDKDDGVRRAVLFQGAPNESSISPDLLVPMLKDNNEDIARRAAEILANKGDLRALDYVKTMADDPEQWRRMNAFRLLAAMKDPAATDVIVSRINDKDPRVAREAIFQLGEMKDERAIEPLIKLLAAKDNMGTVARAASLLGQMKDPRAIDPLVALLETDDFSVMGNAVRALRAQYDDKAMERFTEMYKSDKPTLRRAGLYGLASVRDPDTRETPQESLDILNAALTSEDAALRVDALKVVAANGVKVAFESVQPFMSDKNIEVRKSAITALGRTRDERAYEPLAAALKDDIELKRAAVNALGFLGDKRAMGSLMDLLTDDDQAVRDSAARSIEKLRAEDRPAIAP